MRELTVRIKFTTACLGNVKKQQPREKWPHFLMPRTPDGKVRFEAQWWKHSLKFAATVLCRHQRAVNKIHFDVSVDGKTQVSPDKFFKRYLDGKKFLKHEAFMEGDIIGVNCIVPADIDDDDFWRLMDIVGRFKGISPFGPREYGFFVDESISRRKLVPPKDSQRRVISGSEDIQGRKPSPDPRRGSEGSKSSDASVNVYKEESDHDASRASDSQQED